MARRLLALALAPALLAAGCVLPDPPPPPPHPVTPNGAVWEVPTPSGSYYYHKPSK